jgi:hypothetical protein
VNNYQRQNLPVNTASKISTPLLDRIGLGLFLSVRSDVQMQTAKFIMRLRNPNQTNFVNP